MNKLNQKIEEAIATIACFPKESQAYWINTLDLLDSEKGFLVMYFGLLEIL